MTETCSWTIISSYLHNLFPSDQCNVILPSTHQSPEWSLLMNIMVFINLLPACYVCHCFLFRRVCGCSENDDKGEGKVLREKRQVPILWFFLSLTLTHTHSCTQCRMLFICHCKVNCYGPRSILLCLDIIKKFKFGI